MCGGRAFSEDVREDFIVKKANLNSDDYIWLAEKVGKVFLVEGKHCTSTEI